MEELWQATMAGQLKLIDLNSTWTSACTHVAIRYNVVYLQDPEDYGEVLGALREGGDARPPAELRRRLAWKAFQHCATYDSTVAEWLWGQIGVGHILSTR